MDNFSVTAIALLRGLGMTLQITAGGAVIAIIVGLVAGLARLAPYRIVRGIAITYVEIFRGTSALVQLFWFYFVLPAFGIDLNALSAAILVLGLNTGAYGAEVVRGAMLAVPRGQLDAAAALNLSRWQTLRFVLFPQAAMAMLPPAGNLIIELLKNSALVSLIAITDLTFAAQLARSATLQSGQTFALVLVLYFAAALCITGMFRTMERTLKKGRAV